VLGGRSRSPNKLVVVAVAQWPHVGNVLTRSSAPDEAGFRLDALPEDLREDLPPIVSAENNRAIVVDIPILEGQPARFSWLLLQRVRWARVGGTGPPSIRLTGHWPDPGAVSRIEGVHKKLGHHLRRSIRTVPSASVTAHAHGVAFRQYQQHA
jgi:hypothetical protein